MWPFSEREQFGILPHLSMCIVLTLFPTILGGEASMFAGGRERGRDRGARAARAKTASAVSLMAMAAADEGQIRYASPGICAGRRTVPIRGPRIRPIPGCGGMAPYRRGFSILGAANHPLNPSYARLAATRWPIIFTVNDFFWGYLCKPTGRLRTRVTIAIGSIERDKKRKTCSGQSRRHRIPKRRRSTGVHRPTSIRRANRAFSEFRRWFRWPPQRAMRPPRGSGFHGIGPYGVRPIRYRPLNSVGCVLWPTMA
jgi:hypothetical protein